MRLPVFPAVPASVSPARSLRGLNTARSFQALLRRERARADRTGREFTVVVLRAGADEPRAGYRVARALVSRVRATDEVGWFGADALYAMLPDTNASGAWKLARDVCAAVEERVGRPSCLVYTYPSAGRAEEGAEFSTAARPAGPRPAEGRQGRTPRREELFDLLREGFAGGTEPPADVRGAEELFVRPVRAWKRAMDVAVAAGALLLLSPLLSAVAGAIKLTSPGPVIFRQVRAGRGGRPFVMYKFRTMVPDAEERKRELMARNEQDGPAFKMKDDPRVTRLGKFLRAASIDELPQLWNVLRGEMTLVGPRPLPCAEARACERWHNQRLDVTPGLTCIWQVEGRSRVTFDQWMRMDLRYIRGQSLLADVRILLQTIPAVLWRRNGR